MEVCQEAARKFRYQDGDEEGVLILSRMPDECEAQTLRLYIGLRQTREVSPEAIQKLNDAHRKGRSGPHIG